MNDIRRIELRAMVRELDFVKSRIGEVTEGSELHAYYDGERHGIRLCLAVVAGTMGYRTVEELVKEVNSRGLAFNDDGTLDPKSDVPADERRIVEDGMR